MKNMAW